MLVYGMPPAEIPLNLHTFTRSTSGSSLVAASALNMSTLTTLICFAQFTPFLKNLRLRLSIVIQKGNESYIPNMD